MTSYSPPDVMRRQSLIAIFAALLLAVTSIQAQERPEPLRDGDLLTGQRMRFVFRDVVKQATAYTVAILADGERIALGTIVRSDGWIVSKASQINKGTRVELADGRQFAMQVRGVDRKLDLALLKIEAIDLPTVTWDLQEPQLGAWMVSVGMPPDYVAAVGVMSVPRHAIPRSESQGYLGVELELEQEDGACIKNVLPHSAAAVAGLQKGDIVVALDEQTISTGQQLARTLKTYRPGDILSLKIRRSDAEIGCSVTLMHQHRDFLSRMAFQNQMGGDLSFRRDDFEAVYQHDAVIDPKDCGGPVVNLDGKATGINIARAGRTESYALPADLIERVIENLKATGHDDSLPVSIEAGPQLAQPPAAH